MMNKSKKEERNRLLKERVRLGLLRSYRNLEVFLANEEAAGERGIINALLEWRDAFSYQQGKPEYSSICLFNDSGKGGF